MLIVSGLSTCRHGFFNNLSTIFGHIFAIESRCVKGKPKDFQAQKVADVAESSGRTGQFSTIWTSPTTTTK
jgi:hypothetical protein